ncbi:MAG: MATE family efflux transporter [Clostridiaceae bacterium]
MKLDILQDKKFNKTVLNIAVPIAFQSFLASSLNLIDTVMVGQLGDKAIAAIGLCNQVFMILSICIFSICSGGVVFASQFWGNNDIKNIKRVQGIMLIINIIISCMFFICVYFAPKAILSIFTKDTTVISLGIEYFKIISFSYIITAVSSCYATMLKSIGQVKLAMKVSIISIFTNTLLNYLLITGNMGFPSLGVSGAALATVVSRIVEVSILLIVIYKNNYITAAKLTEMFDFSVDLLKVFLSKTIPILIKDLVWILGTTLYVVVYARIGTQELAAINIANTIQNVSFFMFNGVGSACAIMVGRELGREKFETSYIYGKKFLLLGIFLSIFVSIILFLSTGLLGRIFNINYEVLTITKHIVIILSISLFFRVFNNISIVGIFRSGGDVKFCLLLDFIAVWLIGLPLCVMSGLILKYPIEIVFILVSTQEVFKFIVSVKRFKSRKWLNNLVKGIG